ncbi:MAG TPA: DNA-3-methyladenine glycosylase 2 family protein [Planosporangium sp.]|jgi:3-methyladenine DNA glycosylase/8-oxoguanine DNA glycosylase|nr:DNA-3-methyladenine glycosylase 2 family protein [Planosporangium sp.]
MTAVVPARRLDLPEHYDLAGTLAGLAVIRNDPTVRADSREGWWVTRTPDGPGTLRLTRDGDALVARGYGPGAGWLLMRADAISGLRDDLDGFAAVSGRHELVRRLARVHRGRRMPASGLVFHHLVPAVLGQKVTYQEAYRSYRALLRHFGEPAPGAPHLCLPPQPASIAATPYYLFHPFGIEQRRADTLRRAADRAAALERATDAADAARRLTTLAGIGPWTAAEVVRASHGDPDAVSVGDYHLPDIVAWALAGEPRADDRRMLELLEPFRGHRGRVCRLIMAAGIGAPKYGPRFPIRSFAHF